MNEQSKVVVASIAGAALGALVGYLYLTTKGRHVLEQMEPRIDEVAEEIRRLRGTLTRAQAVASEGWRALNELIGERRPSGAYPAQQRQSSPF